jgi:hypothetical protein
MRDTALFVGWGKTYPERMKFALKHEEEWKEILVRLKEEGEIEDYQTVLLGPHGGELDGFTLVFGTPEKLALLPMRKELELLRTKAMLDHSFFIVVPAVIGEGVEREFSRYQEIIHEYEREPALV